MKSLFTFLIAVSLCFGFANPSMAKDYPSRTINIINPFLPGGWMDLAVRPLTEALGKELDATIINTPTPGAGGSIGHLKVASSKNDGYTLLLTIPNTLIANSMLRDVRYSTDSFEPVAAFCMTSSALFIKSDENRFKTLDEFITYAKNNPGKISLGVPGTKNTPAVAAALFQAKTGIKLTWVPFNGALQVSAAVSSGHVDSGISQMLTIPGIKTLISFGDPMDAYQDIPTAKDRGFDFVWTDYLAIYAPKGIAPENKEKLEKAILKAAKSPAVQEVLAKLQLTPASLTAKQLEEHGAINTEKLEEVIKLGIITPEKKK